jgi:hypothetical protein
MVGSGRDLIWGIVMSFAWSDWARPQKASSRLSVPGPEFEPKTSGIRSTCAKYSACIPISKRRDVIILLCTFSTSLSRRSRFVFKMYAAVQCNFKTRCRPQKFLDVVCDVVALEGMYWTDRRQARLQETATCHKTRPWPWFRRLANTCWRHSAPQTCDGDTPQLLHSRGCSAPGPLCIVVWLD